MAFPDITWQTEGLVTTTKGLMPAEALRKRETRTEIFETWEDGVEDHIETAMAVEYYDADELVHRSAHVLKHKVSEDLAVVLQQIGG